MPRISAPTLAEHRQRQVAALLDAARAVLLESGVEGLTFSAVAARTGIARNSVYEYYSGREDLLIAVAEAEVPRWVDRVTLAMASAPDPVIRVEAFVRDQLRMVAEGEHRLGSLLMTAPLPEATHRRLRALHAPLAGPLVDALTALGVPDPGTAASLVSGLVRTAAASILAGAPPAELTDTTVALVLGGVTGLRRDGDGAS